MWYTLLLVNCIQCITTHGIRISIFHSTLVVFMRPEYEYRLLDSDPSPFSDFNSDELLSIKCQLVYLSQNFYLTSCA